MDLADDASVLGGYLDTAVLLSQGIMDLADEASVLGGSSTRLERITNRACTESATRCRRETSLLNLSRETQSRFQRQCDF